MMALIGLEGVMVEYFTDDNDDVSTIDQYFLYIFIGIFTIVHLLFIIHAFSIVELENSKLTMNCEQIAKYLNSDDNTTIKMNGSELINLIN